VRHQTASIVEKFWAAPFRLLQQWATIEKKLTLQTSISDLDRKMPEAS
jgi:hypothetical protein